MKRSILGAQYQAWLLTDAGKEWDSLINNSLPTCEGFLVCIKAKHNSVAGWRCADKEKAVKSAELYLAEFPQYRLGSIYHL